MRASRARPVRTASAMEPTPAMRAAPRARQKRNKRNPPMPPRSSRPASRQASGSFRAALGPAAASACDDAAIEEPHQTAAAPGKRRVVGDQHQSGAAPTGEIEHQLDHLAAGLAVEIAGGLIGQQQRWLDGEGSRQGRALLLPAGELTGIVAETMAK